MKTLLASVRALLHDLLPQAKQIGRNRLRPRLEILEDRLAPAIITSLYNTGVDDLGNVLADGAADPHYSITAAPSPVTPGPTSVVLQNGFPFDGHWLPDGDLSKWIAPHANQNDFAGGVSEPPGDYSYQTTFDLTGFDPLTASIAGQYSADNTLVQVRLNGVDAGVPSGTSTDYFGFHSFTIGAGFQEGVNTLEFVVRNLPQVDYPDNLHNPSGLRVEMTGTAATDNEITATLTADNHYGLYYGSGDGSNLTLVGRNELGAAGNPGTSNWSLPETWTFAPAEGDFIYVVAWDGLNEPAGDAFGGPQSWLGQFELANDVVLLSDTTHWQYVVGSGLNPSRIGGDGELPTLADLMTDIAGATWLTPQAAAANGTAPWGTIPDIAASADFIWADTFDANATSDEHYVIFRTAAPAAPANAPPEAALDFVFTDENVALTVDTADLLANDFDADGDALQILTVTGVSAAGGTVVLNDNGTPADLTDDTVEYTPPTNFFGVDTFEYTLRDAHGWTDTATVFVSVNSIDGVRATLTADNHYGLYYGSADGSSLTLVGRNEVGAAGNPGTANWSLPESYTFNLNPSDHIYVVVWDDGGPQMMAGEFELPNGVSLVTDATHWEYVVAPGTNPGENGAVPPLSELMATIAGATWQAPQASAPNGTAPWNSIPGLSDDVQFLWHDTLAADSSSDGHYVIYRTALPVNRYLTLDNPGPQDSAEGQEGSLQLGAGQSGGLALTYSAQNLPAGLTIDQNTGVIFGTIDYSAAQTQGGSYAVTVSVTDGFATVSQAFTWTVADTNRLVLPIDQGNEEGDVIVFALFNKDLTGPFEYSASGLPPGLSIDPDTGVITGTLPYSAGETNYTVTVSVTAGGETDTQQFSWFVADRNRLWRPDDQASREGQTVALQLETVDNPGSGLVFSAVGLPDGLSIDPDTGLISGTIAAVPGGTTGSTPVTISVTAAGETDSRTFNWITLRGMTPTILLAINGTLRTEDDLALFEPEALSQQSIPVGVILYAPSTGGPPVLHDVELSISSKGSLSQQNLQMYDGQVAPVLMTPLAVSEDAPDVILQAKVDGAAAGNAAMANITIKFPEKIQLPNTPAGMSPRITVRDWAVLDIEIAGLAAGQIVWLIVDGFTSDNDTNGVARWRSGDGLETRYYKVWSPIRESGTLTMHLFGQSQTAATADGKGGNAGKLSIVAELNKDMNNAGGLLKRSTGFSVAAIPMAMSIDGVERSFGDRTIDGPYFFGARYKTTAVSDSGVIDDLSAVEINEELDIQAGATNSVKTLLAGVKASGFIDARKYQKKEDYNGAIFGGGSSLAASTNFQLLVERNGAGTGNLHQYHKFTDARTASGPKVIADSGFSINFETIIITSGLSYNFKVTKTAAAVGGARAGHMAQGTDETQQIGF